MDTIRHLSLGGCLLCAIAGMIRVFWPENSFKSVINTVLVLYILASVAPLALNANWNNLGQQLRSWARNDFSGFDVPAYEEYAVYVGQQASANAIETQLRAQGISAKVTITADLCTVILGADADTFLAEQIIQNACKDLPYQIVQGGEQP